MIVIDASAVLAILFDEAGGDVALVAAPGALLSAVNFTEVVEKVARRTGRADTVTHEVGELEIAIVPFDQEQAHIAAALKPKVGKKDSLADRACLALALSRGGAVVTADTRWAELNIGVEVRLIRDWR